jgi:transposase
MMSTTALKPVTTPIPVQLSEPEFEAFILPHLSMPKRGPKCKLGYYRVFNFILWVLYTGMQWKCLFNAAIHALRMRVERTFAWEDKFKRLLLRFERIQQRHYGMKLMAYTLINLRAFCGT